MFNILKRFGLLSDFFPFQDMRGVKELTLEPEQDGMLDAALDIGIDAHHEFGAYITVKRKGSKSTMVNLYQIPDEFTNASHVFIPKAEASDWWKELYEELVGKKEKIGYYFHTHCQIMEHSTSSYEEWKTARRTRDLKEEAFMEPEQAKLWTAKRRLGDIVSEKVGPRRELYCFTPAKKPYFEGTRLRETNSVYIFEPVTGQKFDSRLR